MPRQVRGIVVRLGQVPGCEGLQPKRTKIGVQGSAIITSELEQRYRAPQAQVWVERQTGKSDDAVCVGSRAY